MEEKAKELNAVFVSREVTYLRLKNMDRYITYFFISEDTDKNIDYTLQMLREMTGDSPWIRSGGLEQRNTALYCYAAGCLLYTSDMHIRAFDLAGSQIEKANHNILDLSNQEHPLRQNQYRLHMTLPVLISVTAGIFHLPFLSGCQQMCIRDRSAPLQQQLRAFYFQLFSHQVSF